MWQYHCLMSLIMSWQSVLLQTSESWSNAKQNGVHNRIAYVLSGYCTGWLKHEFWVQFYRKEAASRSAIDGLIKKFEKIGINCDNKNGDSRK